MRCPVCKEVDLVMSDRQGVEIDYCPTCRGVWLDRGELDKITEQASAMETSRRGGYGVAPRGEQHDDHAYPGRRKSWLGQLFD